MSLLRLLAAGRSLVGMKDITARYRMRTAGLLPKFGSPKNPFATPTKAESKSKPGIAPEAGPITTKPEPAKMETVPLFDGKPKASVAPITPVVPAAPAAPAKAKEPVREAIQAARPELKPKPAKLVTAPRKPVAFGGWVTKINPFPLLRRLKPGTNKSPKARPARAAVQGELSLEKVKVVRNDLNDADVELMPMRPAVVTSASSAVLPSTTKTGPTTWNRLTSRFVGAGESLTH
jgi:hypothetical protein